MITLFGIVNRKYCSKRIRTDFRFDARKLTNLIANNNGGNEINELHSEKLMIPRQTTLESNQIESKSSRHNSRFNVIFIVSTLKVVQIYT